MIFMIKLNDSRNGLSSLDKQHFNNSIYIHKIAKKNGIRITNFDYIPEFGIRKCDWIDELHWTNNFYLKWTNWIIDKILLLLDNNNIEYKKKKILIVSDSSLDYYDKKYKNRIFIFKKILTKNNILSTIIAKGGGSFSSYSKNNNFYNMITKKKLIKKKYSSIIIIGGINDCFIKNKNKIKCGLYNFTKFSKKFLL